MEQAAAIGQYAPPPEQSAPETSAYPPATTCQPGEDCGEPLVEAPQPPPPLLVYQQPVCPGPDYIWTPGYWDYAAAGYYWVPGAWVLAPYIDALWTPPYWAYYDHGYRWHTGYWGRYVGFYGGINYGFGYTGLGFYGGYWNNGAFVYNRAVANVDPRTVVHVYNTRVVNVTPFNRVSYNGPGGISREPTRAELAVRSEVRVAPLQVQVEHRRDAAADRAQFAGAGGGHPALVAQAHPLLTPYRAPAPAPRSWQEHRAAVPVQPARTGTATGRPGEPLPAARGAVPEHAPQIARQPQPAAPVMRLAPQPRAPQFARQAPAARPEARPAPQAHFAARPAPPNRGPEMARSPHPSAPMMRPAPQARAPEPHPQMQPARPAMRQAPQAHAPAPHPVQANRGPEMARQAHPAAPPARSAPQAHAAAPRPAPKSGPPQHGEQHHHG